jgi:phasin family protein
MFNQSKPGSTHETAAGSNVNLETALKIATIMAEANERLFKLQSDAGNAAFSENAKQLRALLNTKDSSSLLTEWSGRYQANVRRILEVTRTCFEIVPHTQTEMRRRPWSEALLRPSATRRPILHLPSGYTSKKASSLS